MLLQLTLKTKLLLSLLMMGLIPFIIIGYFATHKANIALSEQAFNHLESVREIKKSQLENFLAERDGDIQSLTDMLKAFRHQALQKIQAVQEHKKAQVEEYFKERHRDLKAWSQDEFMVEAVSQFDGAFKLEGLQIGGLAWSSVETQIGQKLIQYTAEQHSYEDLLLINKEGDVVYSILKGAELGNNVLTGVLENSQLKLAFAQAVTGTVAIQDFAPYALTKDTYQAFIAAPLSQLGEIIGVLMLRFSPTAINHITQKRQGMGKSGDNFLVGQLGDKILYRSDSNFDKQGVIGEKYLGTEASLGLAGNSGILLVEDENEQLKFKIYSPLSIPNLRWMILTVVNLEELFAVENKLQGQESLLEKYIRYYNYEDLLLIHPTGKIFYTVRHKADYGTNILAGKWSNSELAKSVHNVLENKEIVFSDYVPYPPNHHEPTAFIAHPLLNEKEEVEVIIVLELNKNITNKIMLERSGMGKTGESYLVGPDHLLRSDTFLDQIHHSMSASFSNPEQGRVKTLSVELALQGNSGKHLILNYQGIPVLSTYAPVKVGQTTWALVTEMSKTEAFAKIQTLQWIIAAVAGLGMLMIGTLALWLTSGLIGPIRKIVSVVNGLSKGRLPETVDFPVTKSQDEVMIMQQSVYQLSYILQNIVTNAQKTVEAAKNGDLSQRIAADSLEGFMHALGENINALIGTMDEVMKEIRQVMSALAEGRLNQQMKENYRGVYAEVSQFTRMTMGNLQKILLEIELIVENAGRGSLDGRIDLGNKCGFSETLSSRVNALLDIQQRFTRDVSILLENLKNGDLSEPIRTEYVGCFEQVKLNANLALENLVAVLLGIKETVRVIRSQVEGIEEGNAALSNRTEEQAAFLEETAASMEQMTATVQQNAHNAQIADQLATSATQIAKQGSQVINGVIDKMEQINHSSQKISAISDVINEIAFQTNLLALNASVEAARAGEQGRGFAVVATEVRNLAQRSASAAKEINQLIQTSVKDVQAGSQLVNGAGETMDHILLSIQKVTDIVAEISAASVEQSEGIKQVNVAMGRIDGMTQQNNLLVEKVTTSIRELSKQANYLQTALEQFKLRH